jgi:hypothetical protein
MFEPGHHCCPAEKGDFLAWVRWAVLLCSREPWSWHRESLGIRVNFCFEAVGGLGFCMPRRSSFASFPCSSQDYIYKSTRHFLRLLKGQRNSRPPTVHLFCHSGHHLLLLQIFEIMKSSPEMSPAQELSCQWGDCTEAFMNPGDLYVCALAPPRPCLLCL